MQHNRIAMFSIIVAAILGVVTFLVVRSVNSPLAEGNNPPAVHSSNHDLYNPARAALINARGQLAESFSQEEDIVEQLQRAHRELDASLTLLARAQEIDPTMKAPIDALRAKLSALENDPSVARMDTETLRSNYVRLLDEFEALIEHY